MILEEETFFFKLLSNCDRTYISSVKFICTLVDLQQKLFANFYEFLRLEIR